ncbi:MAG: TonB-dependent receptor, partial [Polyangiales bacterium]
MEDRDGRRRSELPRTVVGVATLACACGLALSAWGTARAQEFGATAEVERPIPSGSEEDPTAAATVVEREDRPRAAETTDEVMDEVPGARTRRTGALGAFTGLSLRGADLDQTTVLLGDVPLGPVDGGAFDLSTIPLSMLERVEVYRGGAPLGLGAGNVGGVVRLVPRDEQGTRAEGTLGVGSFGLLTANAAASVVGERGTPAWNTVVGARHTDGDYPYLDDGGTRFDDSDDVQRRRQNAQLDEAWGLARMQLEAGDGTLDVIGAGFERTGGLTGSPVEEPTRTRRNRMRTLGIVSWGSDDDAETRVRVTAASGFDRNALSDRLGEIAVPRLTDDRTVRGYARADVEHDVTDWLGIATLGSYAVERYDPEDVLAQRPVGSSVRHTVAVGAEARLHGELGDTRVELRPSARLDVSEARLRETRPERADAREDEVIEYVIER